MTDHYAEQREQDNQDDRKEALDWLVNNIQHWPQPQHLPDNGVSKPLFKNWRFTALFEQPDVIVFGNGLVPGITKDSWQQACPTGEQIAAELFEQCGDEMKELIGWLMTSLANLEAEGECPESAECDDPGCPYHYASDGEPVDGDPTGVQPVAVSDIVEFVPNKYHRKMRVAPNQVSILTDKQTGNALAVDVWVDGYDVMDSFGGSSAVDHAMKKLIALGQRGHKSYAEDLDDVIASLQREKQRIQLAEVELP